MINIINKYKIKKTLSKVFNLSEINKKDLIIVTSLDNIISLAFEIRKHYIPFFSADKILFEDNFEHEKQKLFEEANAKFIYILYLKKERPRRYPIVTATVFNDMRPSYFKTDNIIIYDKQKCINGKNLYVNSRDLYKEVYSID